MAVLAADGVSVDALVVAGVVALVWWALFAAAFVARRPPHLRASGDTGLDLPAEPPAVAGLLAGDFVVPGETAPAIVLDLAARGYLDLDEVQPGHTLARLRATGPAAASTGAELTPYETRVLDELRRKAIDGVVPTEALTTGPEDQSARWHRDLAREVVDAAQSAGLTVARWPAALLVGLGLGPVAIVAVLVVAAQIGGNAHGDRVTVGVVAAAVAVAGAAFGFLALGRLGRSLAQLPTASGRTAAARSIGLAAQLRANAALGDLPPAGVKLWDRLFAYAAAFGAAPLAVALLPMGAEDDHRAWSRATGGWRRVRVRYPRGFPPAWGKHPLLATALALFWGVVAGAIIYGLTQAADVSRPGGVSRDTWDWFGRGVLLAVIPAALVILWALVVLVRAIPDLFQTRTVTGEIVRERRYRQWFSSGDDPKYWYYEAVDAGASERVAAWRVDAALWHAHDQGDFVAATVTPRLGHVRTMTAATRPAPTPGAPAVSP